MRSVLALAALSAATFLLGCSSDDPVGPSISSAEVRVAHLSPDAPAVDVFVDGTRVLSGVPFKAVSDYLEVPAGSHRITVTPAGATAPVVIDATVTLAGRTSYTVAATGLLAAGDLQPIVLVDERSSPGDKASVRFVHAVPDAPAVDVTVDGGPFLVRNVAFRQSQGYVQAESAVVSLQVRPTGSSAVVLDVPRVVLMRDTSYTAFAVGRLGNGTLSALLVEDSY